MKSINKLRLGFGFIFLIVAVFAANALFYIHEISKSAKAILSNNYETLSFTGEMRKIIDQNSVPWNADTKNVFNRFLTFQEHNITEKGEREATAKLRVAFRQLTKPDLTGDGIGTITEMRNQLRQIESLNMTAILRKDAIAQKSAANAIVLLSLIGGCLFMLLISFSMNFFKHNMEK